MKVNSNKAQSMQDVLKQLEDGVQAVFTSENYISFLKMMAQFHNYSYNNVILILTQCPTATRCASFQTWKKLGHPVKRGEKGIKVLVPIPYTYEKKQKTVDEDGNAIMETVDAKGLTFRIGHVFDAQQVPLDRRQAEDVCSSRRAPLCQLCADGALVAETGSQQHASVPAQGVEHLHHVAHRYLGTLRPGHQATAGMAGGCGLLYMDGQPPI